MPGWKRTLFVASVAQLMSMMAFSFVFPFIPLYIQQDLGVPDKLQAAAWSGWLSFCLGVSMAVFSPVWGYLADKYGRKIMLERAMFGGAVILTLMGVVRTPQELLLLRTIQGAITGTLAANITLVTSVSPLERTGASLGIMQAAGFAGAALGTLLGGAAAEQFGYRAPFFIVGSLLWCAGVLVVFGTEERFTRAPVSGGRHHEKLMSVLKVAGFPMMIAVVFVFRYGITIFQPVFALFVKDLVGEDGAASTTGNILAVARILAFISAILVTRVAARAGYKRVFIVGVLFAALMAASQAFVRNVWELFGLRVAFGFFLGFISPMANVLVSMIVPRHSYGKAYGFTHSITCIGRAAGGLTGGSVAKYGGEEVGLRLPFGLTGAALLVAALIAAFGLKKQEPTPPFEEPSDLVNSET